MTDTLQDQRDFIEAIEDYIKALALITSPDSPNAKIIQEIDKIITDAKQNIEQQLYY